MSFGLGGQAHVQFDGAPEPLCGGSVAQPTVNAECAALVAKHRGEAEVQLGKKFPKWEAIQMQTQVVAGVNYHVKVDAGIEYVHLRIHSGFGDISSLSYVKGDLHAFTPLDTWNGS